MHKQPNYYLICILLAFAAGMLLAAIFGMQPVDMTKQILLLASVCVIGSAVELFRAHGWRKKRKKEFASNKLTITAHPGGDIRVIPAHGTAWTCANYSRALTITEADGRCTYALIVSKLDQQGKSLQALSIDGNCPPGDDWTTGEISNVCLTAGGISYTVTHERNGVKEQETITVSR
ncbi:MAG: hypothetical protein ACOYUK_04105 [Patescibacteria group bacterium]